MYESIHRRLMPSIEGPNLKGNKLVLPLSLKHEGVGIFNLRDLCHYFIFRKVVLSTWAKDTGESYTLVNIFSHQPNVLSVRARWSYSRYKCSLDNYSYNDHLSHYTHSYYTVGRNSGCSHIHIDIRHICPYHLLDLRTALHGWIGSLQNGRLVIFRPHYSYCPSSFRRDICTRWGGRRSCA